MKIKNQTDDYNLYQREYVSPIRAPPIIKSRASMQDDSLRSFKDTNYINTSKDEHAMKLLLLQLTSKGQFLENMHKDMVKRQRKRTIIDKLVYYEIIFDTYRSIERQKNMIRYCKNNFIYSDYYDMKLKRFSQNEFFDKMIKSKIVRR